MFNVRPDALSPWLYVEQPPESEPPGIRVAPDGSVMDAKKSAFSAPGGPPTGTDFEDAIRRTAGGLYGPADLAMLPRDPVQQALDEIATIYAGFGTKPSDLLDRQVPSADMATPVDGRLPPQSAIESSHMSPRVEQSTVASPVSHIEVGRPPMIGPSFSSPSANLRQTDPQLAPSPAPERRQAPDDQESSSPWLQANLPSQLGGEPLLGRASSDVEPMSLPVRTTGAGMPSAVIGDGIGVGTTLADDVQIAQAPRPQQRTPVTPPIPRQQKLEPTPSEQQLQVKATQQLNTRLERANTWENLLRSPLPDNMAPTRQQPLPNDWEGALTKMNPTYLKWTKAAADKHGIPPELLARLLYKESTYDRNQVSDAGAKGIAQLMPDAVKDLGFDPKTFDYFNAEKSINAGAAHLAKAYRELKDWPKAVAAYNMGVAGLNGWLDGTSRAKRLDGQTETMLMHIFRGDPQAFNNKR